jgi:hypothetical protein
MKRRLYFLFPDALQARIAVDDLTWHGVSKWHIHAVARAGASLEGLPKASASQRRDLLHHLERIWWNTNLAVFFLALLGLLIGVLTASTAWSVAMLAVMIATLVLGVFETGLPSVGLDELRDALHHGEVLLLVDVPQTSVVDIENFLHSRHPAVTSGGVSWTIERFGM